MKKLAIALALIGTTTTVNAQRYVGYLAADPSSIAPAVTNTGANAVAFGGNNYTRMKQFFAAVPAGVKPMVEGTAWLWNPSSGLYSWTVASLIYNVWKANKAIIWLDEPFWRVRNACWQGRQASCYEVNAGYPNTRAVIANLKSQTGLKILHIESWAELILQENQFGHVINLPAADYVSYDCYSWQQQCGNAQLGRYYSFTYWSMIERQMQPHQKKWLTTGTFFHSNFYLNNGSGDTSGSAAKAVRRDVNEFNSNPSYAGMGGFLWDTIPGDNPGETYIGAEDSFTYAANSKRHNHEFKLA